MGVNKSKVPFVVWPYTTEEEQLKALESSEQLKEFKAYRDKIRNHKYTPKYHFYAPDGNLNDPNGFCYYNGYYHMFYQQYPPIDPRQHWGHAISKDLMHWKDLPTAIYPDPEKCCFSGSALVEEDRVLAMYHGLELGNMIAESKDPLLLNWTKLTNDAVIKIEEGTPYRVFDPHLRKEEDGYYALSGVFRETEIGRRFCIDQFFSEDLVNWKYIGEFMDENIFLTMHNDGACPYFVHMKDDQYCLLHFSHETGPHIYSGTYDKVTHKFKPHHHCGLSMECPGAGSFNAPSVIPNGNGSAYIVFNLCEGRYDDPEYPRKGCMSMVYELWLGRRNEPYIVPLKDIGSLHKDVLYSGNFKVEAGSEFEVPARGRALDIYLNVDLSKASGFTLDVFRSEKERTSIKYSQRYRAWRDRAYVTIDTSDASLDPLKMGRTVETLAVNGCGDGGTLDLRVFIDYCTVEVFCNGAVICSMTYPSLPESDKIFVRAGSGDIDVKNMVVWKMDEIM